MHSGGLHCRRVPLTHQQELLALVFELELPAFKLHQYLDLVALWDVGRGTGAEPFYCLIRGTRAEPFCLSRGTGAEPFYCLSMPTSWVEGGTPSSAWQCNKALDIERSKLRTYMKLNTQAQMMQEVRDCTIITTHTHALSHTFSPPHPTSIPLLGI